MKRLRKIVNLSPAERRLLVAAWWELRRVARDLRRRPLPEVVAACRKRGQRHARPALPPSQTVALVAVAARLGLRRLHCLEQALAGHAILTAMGTPHRLRIGVERPDGGFRAHAWLEVDGVALDPGSPTLRTIWSTASQPHEDELETTRAKAQSA